EYRKISIMIMAILLLSHMAKPDPGFPHSNLCRFNKLMNHKMARRRADLYREIDPPDSACFLIVELH
ncbi:MAG TPA: hypothetical protein VGC34_00305, partial [Steroidobacteraceae bacterium]